MTLMAVLADGPLRVVHLLVAAAWIGANIGLLYVSAAVRRKGLSAETRGELVKALGFLELVVSVCLLLIIPLGIGFVYAAGLGLHDLGNGSANALFWGLLALTAAWIAAHWRENRELGAGMVATPFQRVYTPVSWVLRLVFCGFFLITGATSLAGSGIWASDHIAWKAILLGFILGMERLTNYLFRDFGPVFAELVIGGETPERFDRFNRLFLNAYPPVLTLYAAIIAGAIIGVTGL